MHRLRQHICAGYSRKCGSRMRGRDDGAASWTSSMGVFWMIARLHLDSDTDKSTFHLSLDMAGINTGDEASAPYSTVTPATY